MNINPITIYGIWDIGWALDKHTISSTYIGEIEYGYPQYDTVRTEIGEKLFQLKYRHKNSIIDELAKVSISFLERQNIEKIDYVIPVPPTMKRDTQPVIEIAHRISDYINLNFFDNILVKTSSEQSKNMDRNNKTLDGTIKLNRYIDNYKNILLIDDLYSTGQTLSECVRILKRDSRANKVYVLAMTKTR